MRNTVIGIAAGLTLLASAAPASARDCSSYEVLTDPGLATAAEVDQLRKGMTYEQVQALFGSPGGISRASEGTSGRSMDVVWLGAVRRIDWFGGTTDSEVEVSFSMQNATTETVYTRKKVRVKNVKRAKRLGLPKWKWKKVKEVRPVPATPYTVDYFSVSHSEILRQTGALDCYS